MKYQGKNPLEKLHPGEPYFFIRAQDILSYATVREYAKLLMRMAQTLDDADPKRKSLKRQAGDVIKFAETFAAWQSNNIDLVKLPD